MDSSPFAFFDNIAVQQVSSTDLLFALDKEFFDLFEIVVNRIRPVLRLSVVRVACSFGKDSNLVLSASLEAHVREVKAGGIPADKPFIVTHIVTGVDDIFVSGQVAYEVESLRRYCRQQGINLVYRTAKPALRYSWAVMYLSGMKLPSFAKSSADCSVVLKVDPAAMLEQDLFVEFGDMTTLLGVRSDESARRAANITKHGLADVEVMKKQVNGRVVKTFAPIVDLTTDEVFGILRRSGTNPIVKTSRPIPTYKPHNKLLIKLYGDASDSCPVTSFNVSVAAGEQRGSCGTGSRFGCYLCLKVTKDKSADSRTRLRQYDRASKVKLIRDWLAHHADDMSLRTWIGKSVDPVTDALVIQANTFNASTLEKLIYWLCQATRDDYLFALNFRKMVAAGEILSDAGYQEILNDVELNDDDRAFFLEHYIEFNQQHMIEAISLEHIMMICAIHARDGVDLPPYRALWIWNEVMEGRYIPWPVIEGNPVVDAVPEPRFFLGNFSHAAFSLDMVHPLASDETSCLVTGVSQYTKVQPLAVVHDGSARPVAKKHAFSRRKITAKRVLGERLVVEKGRMSVAFAPVTEKRSAVANVEKSLVIEVPTTNTRIGASYNVWEDAEVDAGISINAESLDMFLLTDVERCLEKHNSCAAKGLSFYTTEPYSFLVSYGVVQLTNRSMVSGLRMLHRTEQLVRGGSDLNLLSMTSEQLRQHTIGQAEFRMIRSQKLRLLQKQRNDHQSTVLAALAKKESPELYLRDLQLSFVPSLVKALLTICDMHASAALLSEAIAYWDGLNLKQLHGTAENCYQKALNLCDVDKLTKALLLSADCVVTRREVSRMLQLVASELLNQLAQGSNIPTTSLDVVGSSMSSDWFENKAALRAELIGFAVERAHGAMKQIYNTGKGVKKFDVTKLSVFNWQ